MPQTDIAIRGAREHNLKDISLDIPRDKLVVITVFRVRAKARLPLIPFMQKVSAATLSRSQVMRACSWVR